MAAWDCLSTLMALFLPPVAVFMQQGCGCQLLINILLTLLGWIPGSIHALCIVCVTDNEGRDVLPTSQPAGAGAAPYAVAAPMQQAPPPPQYPQGAAPVMQGPPPPQGYYQPGPPPPQPQGTYYPPQPAAPAPAYPTTPPPAGYPAPKAA